MVSLTLTEIEQEKWKPVRDFEDTYEISNFGRVRRILKTRMQSRADGYLFFPLYRNRKAVYRTIHSMVAEAFIGPRPPCHDVHHKDADKRNNRDTNLEYLTRSANTKAAWKAGAWKERKIGRNQWRLTPKQVIEIRRSKLAGYKLAERYHVSQSTIHEVRRGKSYRWVKQRQSWYARPSQSRGFCLKTKSRS